MDARASYEQGRDARRREVSALEARARAIASARLALAVLALALLAAIVWGPLHNGGWAALGVVIGAFVVLVLVHAKIHEARERSSAALRFHERGLARLDHAWDRLPASSARFASADHPFAGDLDVYGRASLMQLLDATETLFGEEHLARLLGQTEVQSWPAEVLARQEAARDLAARFAFRERLATSGGVLSEERTDPGPLLAWAEGRDPPRIAVALQMLAWVAPAAAIALLVLGVLGVVSTGWVTVLVSGEIALGLDVAAGGDINGGGQVVSSGEPRRPSDRRGCVR